VDGGWFLLWKISTGFTVVFQGNFRASASQTSGISLPDASRLHALEAGPMAPGALVLIPTSLIVFPRAFPEGFSTSRVNV